MLCDQIVFAAKSRPHHINNDKCVAYEYKTFWKQMKAARTVKSIWHNLDVIYIEEKIISLYVKALTKIQFVKFVGTMCSKAQSLFFPYWSNYAKFRWKKNWR